MSSATETSQPRTNESGQLSPETGQGARRIWFPFVWTGMIAGTLLLLQYGQADQDVKNFSLTVGPGVVLLGLSAWFAFSSGFSRKVRWSVALAPWLVLLAFMSLIELTNNGDVAIVSWRWRWAPEPDERLEVPDSSLAITDWHTTPEDYPRFLGNGYWAEVPGIILDADWEKNPPKEMWRKKIGAGWSGFAVVGDYAITQEQRGTDELVTCYHLPSGEIVWTHSDPVRFDPIGSGALGGIGPRATPTVHNQRVITQGATGIVNCLDALTGNVLWSHDTLLENEVGNVMWGKAGSPLVVQRDDGNDLVVISVGDSDGRSLIAYDFDTGNEIWSAGERRASYASPVFAELAGQEQILSVNENFVTGHRASDASVLWEHPWPGSSDANATCSQPVPLPGDRVFLSKGYGEGAALLQLEATEDDTIQATQLWKKRVMKTKMGNVVIRDGYVYGLDGGLMQCIELDTGKKRWKKRREPAIGHGQIILVGDVILVLTESGELLLVEASPNEYRELASIRAFPADQITWNNPAFSPPYLLVRNAKQVACYKLPVK